jgi:polyhydroxyalkanoate synthesis regulator phasin
VKMILSRCEIHRGCIIEVFFGEKAGGRIPWPDPDLKPDAERDFPGLVPNHLEHVLKEPNVKARERIGALTAEVADLREENKKLLDQLVAVGFRNVELAQALQADLAVTP